MRTVLVLPEFECRTEFQESRESVRKLLQICFKRLIEFREVQLVFRV